ncbi:MAG: tRNA preQ1(34) S-adenosylmethionine ribosyltransferase-isomerase QueA [Pyrinomonadaceae bacterium]|nr:tRNA preQ1(34) S-adenosylmethionine ribosyltransferase-isomerase QueA [Pyrinomonadaceae bacterium]MCX7640130.1 tRNA preQ1(34) S-adenosylmethionine ribosyltransferase-isomerase QueA [Pyrinomonadaceae bacterium]MDW8303282.1 tRNA preQ1(34) S-adenosylmethionine ribosyltransferase-isomerase QueA [Acidobacteriota bacterium]
MQIEDFDYYLPDELIAQEPLQERDKSRMLVLNRSTKQWKDDFFYNFPEYFDDKDLIVFNNTKVFPARLIGRKNTGAKIEIFLLRQVSNQVWEALAKPARRLKNGTALIFDSNFKATILEKKEDGTFIVSFDFEGEFWQCLEKLGKTPLPPYIKREDSVEDKQRYQTVYAKKLGSVAAPTAGLHFTERILEAIKKRGATCIEITLHVGYGTFEPVRVKDVEKHKVLPEECEITEETAEILNRAKADKKRIVAIGTTTTRALEFFATKEGAIKAGKTIVDLTVTPGYQFKFVDAMLTNFHLPKSSLLIMVSTFAGRELIMSAYRHAVEQKYRFYSYGDCMLIL